MRFRRYVSIALSFFSLLCGLREGHADGNVAVLPFIADNDSLAVFAGPVAAAIAVQLGRELDRTVPVVSEAKVPETVSLVIDGRLLAHSGGRLRLSGSLRNPSRGVAVATLLSDVGEVTDLTKLSHDLARRLAARVIAIERAAADRETAATVSSPIAEQPPTPQQHRKATGVGECGTPCLPRLLVGRVQGGVVGKADQEAADRALRQFVGSVGFAAKAVTVSAATTLPRAQLQAPNVSGLLAIELLDVWFVWRGRVLTARARIHVVLICGKGVLLDDIVTTDTVVGGRGDRRSVLVGLATNQALEIALLRVLPTLRKPTVANAPKQSLGAAPQGR